MHTRKYLPFGVLFFSFVFVPGLHAYQAAGHAQDLESARSSQHINAPEFQSFQQDLQPEVVLTDPDASPDSISWDPARYMHLPFLLRDRHDMNWSAPVVDSQEIFFEKNQDITDSLAPALHSGVSAALSAGDLDGAKALLQEAYGANVEIIKT